MKFKFRSLLLLFITITLYALSPNDIAKAKSMLKANPDLLNSPQAQMFLQGHHKTNTHSDMNKKTKIKSIEIKNKIASKQDQNNTNIEEEEDIFIDKSKNLRLNPLSYEDNNEALWKIKSYQSNLRHPKKLQRFSKDFFLNQNTLNPNTIEAPTNYIINRGDIIKFWIYGATNKQEELDVDKHGNINIPQIGPVHVAGEKFGEVKELLTNYLSSSYKNSQVIVDLNSFSSAQVTVTGFVNAPGIYNTTSVSSVKDILILAHGVSDVGSVRNIQIIRNGKIIQTIDYYHLLISGQDHGDMVLRAGDIIHVPRAYGLITVDGEVNKAAIYEIERGETLANILKFAGGLKAAANGKKIYIKRFNHHTNVEYKTLTLYQAKRFITKDGDDVYIGRLNQSNERYIEVIGNIIDEGKKPIHSSKIKLSKFLKQQIKGKNLNNFFLENTQLDYAMIKRISKDTTTKIYHINLQNVLNGLEDFTLHNRDKIYIFNNLDTKVNPYVTIVDATTRNVLQKQINLLQKIKISKKIQNQFKQIQDDIDLFDINVTDKNYSSKYIDTINRIIKESNISNSNLLLKPGKFTYTKGMTLEDLINMAGVKKPFDPAKVKIVSQYKNKNDIKVKIVDYSNNKNYPLEPFDTVHLFDITQTHPVPMANIIGEVVKPGSYEIVKSMTLNKLIESAGGLTQKAYPKTCEVIRYHLENGERKKKIFNVSMNEINNFIVQQYDEINIKKIPYWDDKKVITLKGEVKFPGQYIIHSGEKLSSVIRRAGGFTKEAFLYGAVFTRKEIAKLQQQSLTLAINKLKEQLILASIRSQGSKTMPNLNLGETMTAVESLMSEAKTTTPKGRISIQLEHDLDNFEYSTSNLTVKNQDVLYIPAYNDTVVVNGEVMNPMATVYLGESIQSYISKTGGLTDVADLEHIYVIHANGEAQRASVDTFLFSSHNVKIHRGDTIIIPKKLMFERNIDMISDIADIFYKLSITVAAMHTVGTF